MLILSMFCQIPRCGIVSADVVVLLDVLVLGLFLDGGVDDIAAVCLFVIWLAIWGCRLTEMFQF